jgi:predicted aspartyl protease
MVNRVTSTRVPYLPIRVEIPERNLTLDLTALVDTGFTSDVIVSGASIGDDAFALLQNDLLLADGSRVTVPGYLGTVRIGDRMIGPVMVMVMGDEPIVGLHVITQFRMTIDHDRSLTVEP